jgi:hypothetical protein
MSSPGRRQSLIFPREHGAWGILLVPLVTGAAVGLIAGGKALPLAPLTIVVLALFWLRTPVESWVGTTPTKARTPGEFELVRNAALILATIAVAALAWLFWGWRNRDLVVIGAAAAGAFAAQAVIRQVWRKSRTAAQMIGAAGLTAVGPAAYYVVTGDLNVTAWCLWLFNFAFAANQIQFVQLRIHGAHATSTAEKLSVGRGFLGSQAILVALLIAACAIGILRWYVAMAFLPVVWRGFAWFVSPFKPLAVHSLGKRELAHAIAFGVLLIVAIALP